MLVFVYVKKGICLTLFLMFYTTIIYASNADVISPSIVINLPSRMLELYSGDTLFKQYPVAIGKPSTPTPLGEFSILDKEVNPTWIPPVLGTPVASGPDNPLGYRWMRFFELYGIHGTNAPWSIGKVVSNGCIRMIEENVEELFPLVKYGTPVKIIYDRIKINIDNKGQATILIYPDVYACKAITLAQMNEKLSQLGLKGLASDAILLRIIREEPETPVFFGQIYNIKVNDQVLKTRGIAIDNTICIPLWPVIEAIQGSFVWEENTKLISRNGHVAKGIVKNNIIYIAEEDIQKLFGGEEHFNVAENVLEISIPFIIVNGKRLPQEVETVNGILAIPVLALAESIGQKVSYDEVSDILIVQGETVPVFRIHNQPYIQITKINQYFKADVFWNEQQQHIEITYPSQAL